MTKTYITLARIICTLTFDHCWYSRILPQFLYSWCFWFSLNSIRFHIRKSPNNCIAVMTLHGDAEYYTNMTMSYIMVKVPHLVDAVTTNSTWAGKIILRQFQLSRHNGLLDGQQTFRSQVWCKPDDIRLQYVLHVQCKYDSPLPRTPKPRFMRYLRFYDYLGMTLPGWEPIRSHLDPWAVDALLYISFVGRLPKN